MDYEKIAASAVHAMKPADLNRFLVVCALVSDLHCPGWNPRQLLEKNSNLAGTAIRYKVDTAKEATAARTELSKTKPSPSSNTQKAKATNRKRTN